MTQWDDTPRPDPVVSITGHIACNAPLVVSGTAVALCQARTKRGRPHKGKHRVEWES